MSRRAEAEQLRSIDCVAPGDMAVVRQNLYYLADFTTNGDRIAALEQEVECRRNYNPRKIGFGS